MEFNGQFTSDHTAEELWKYFTDPDVLAECAPGCKEIAMETPSELTATVEVGVGSVKPTFDVEMVVTAAERPTYLEMEASGSSSRNAFKTVAGMTLVKDGNENTTVEWQSETEVSGLISSMGQRALSSVTKKLVNDFFSDVEEMVDENAGAESKLEAKEDADASIE